MDKFQTYFGQYITNDELNEIFNNLSTAVQQLVQEFGFVGIAAGGDLAPNPTPNLTVQASTPLVSYDQNGNRVLVATSPTIDVSVDENNQPTAVTTASREKWLSVFVQFTSTPSEPRVDDLGESVFYKYVSGYRFNVVQGPEAPANTAPRPALRGDQILLGDIRLTSGQTSVVAGNLSNTRQQLVYAIAGTPVSLRARSVKEAITAMLTQLNGLDASGFQIPSIGNSGSTLTIPPGTLLAALQAIVNAINTLSGSVYSDVARLGNVQTFTKENTFNDNIHVKGTIDSTVDGATPWILSTSKTPGDANTKWKQLFSFKTGGGQYVYIFTGAGPTTYGNFIICVNAVWNSDDSPNKWSQRDTDYPSTALIWTFRYIRVSTQPNGTSTAWTDWPDKLPDNTPNSVGGVSVVGELSVAQTLRVQRQIRINALELGPESNSSTDGQSVTLGLVSESGSINNLYATTLKVSDDATVKDTLTAKTIVGTQEIRSDNGFVSAKQVVATTNLTVGVATDLPTQSNAIIYGALLARYEVRLRKLGSRSAFYNNDIGGEVIYQDVVRRYTRIPVIDGYPPLYWTTNSGGDLLVSPNDSWRLSRDTLNAGADVQPVGWICRGRTNRMLEFPVRLRHGAKLQQIRVLVNYDYGCDIGKLRLVSQYDYVDQTTQVPTTEVLAQNELPSTGGNWTWLDINVPDDKRLIDNQKYEYFLHCQSWRDPNDTSNPGDATPASRIYSIGCVWEDPGPRNY